MKRILLAPFRLVVGLLRRLRDFVELDSPASRKPSPAHYIPNSNGEGGWVINSGHPGGRQ